MPLCGSLRLSARPAYTRFGPENVWQISVGASSVSRVQQHSNPLAFCPTIHCLVKYSRLLVHSWVLRRFSIAPRERHSRACRCSQEHCHSESEPPPPRIPPSEAHDATERSVSGTRASLLQRREDKPHIPVQRTTEAKDAEPRPASAPTHGRLTLRAWGLKALSCRSPLAGTGFF